MFLWNTYSEKHWLNWKPSKLTNPPVLASEITISSRKLCTVLFTAPWKLTYEFPEFWMIVCNKESTFIFFQFLKMFTQHFFKFVQSIPGIQNSLVHNNYYEYKMFSKIFNSLKCMILELPITLSNVELLVFVSR